MWLRDVALGCGKRFGIPNALADFLGTEIRIAKSTGEPNLKWK
jgi:hypothetical protein